MKKIKVIFTGGTIGSRVKNGYIGTDLPPYELIDSCGELCSDLGMEISTCEPYTVLSEDMTAEHYRRLYRCVRQELSQADGLIITHGTDTLCYTAAFLGLAFADTKKPIMLVSSGYPLEDERSNGRENFAAALRLIDHGAAGVQAVWYADGEARSHLGVRIFPHLPYSDMLQSLGGAAAVADKDGVRLLANGLPKDTEPIFAAENFPEALSGFGRVLYLPCRPSMAYPQLSGVGAVLMESYHSGTLCADSRLSEFSRQADSLGVPIFVCGTGGREAEYESVKRYRKMGLIPLPAASPAAMYIKLSLTLSLGSSEPEIIKKIMFTNCGGEIC